MAWPDSDYPGGIDAPPDPDSTLDGTPLHSELHEFAHDAIKKLEQTVGTSPTQTLTAATLDSGTFNVPLNSAFTGTLAVRKIGRWVWFVCNIQYIGSGISAADVTLGTLGVTVRPVVSLGVPAILNTNATSRLTISGSTGVINFASLTAATNNVISATACWVGPA